MPDRYEAAHEVKEIVERMSRITRIETATTGAGLPPILDIGRSSDSS